MEYLVFPFGKYKGVELRELPTTYVAFALEKFELPDELRWELFSILFGRFYVYSFSRDIIDEFIKQEKGLKKGIDKANVYFNKMIDRYEN